MKEIMITGAGSTEIGEITFEKAGMFVYTISEKNSGVEGYTYDSTIYTVTYEVAEKSEDLSVARKDNNDMAICAHNCDIYLGSLKYLN